MTKNQQIRKALELLAPLDHDRAECRHDIELMLEWVGWPAFRGDRALHQIHQGGAAAVDER
jgi:hypothetical protein